MGTTRIIITAFCFLLAACGGGGGGGGGGSEPVSLRVTFSPAAMPESSLVSDAHGFVSMLGFTLKSDAPQQQTLKLKEVFAEGDSDILAGVALRVSGGGNVATIASGGTLLPQGIVATDAELVVPSGTTSYVLEAEFPKGIPWKDGETTKRVRFAVAAENFAANGNNITVVGGKALGNWMYREREDIYFPRGLLINGENWSADTNIWKGNLGTGNAAAITALETAGSIYPRIRFGMVPHPFLPRVLFGEFNDDLYNTEYGMPYSIRSDGTDLVRHTPRICQSTPAFEGWYTPDGSYIVYRTMCSQTDGGFNSDIVAVRTDGTGGFRITSTPEEDESPVVSADGKMIYYFSFGDGKNVKLYRQPIDFASQTIGAPSVVLGDDWNWSPVSHGTQLLYSSQGYNRRRLSVCADGTLVLSYKKDGGADRIGSYDPETAAFKDLGPGTAAFCSGKKITFAVPMWTDLEEWNGWPPFPLPNEEIPFYVMDQDGSNRRKIGFGECLATNWYACLFGLPLAESS